jgi:hypothetical protein
MLVPRGGCRPLQPTRPTPSWHRRQAIAPQGFGLLPVRSPLLRESSLFLGVLRCFSSPGALLGIAPQVPGRAPGGLPHSDIPGSQAASASPGHFAAWPRPSSAANAKASTMRPSCGYPAPSPPEIRRDRDRRPARASGMVPPGRPSAPLPRGHDASWDYGVFLCVSCVCVCCCAVRAGKQTRARRRLLLPGRADGSDRARPQQGLASSRGRRTRRVPRGALSRCTTAKSSDLSVLEVVKPRPKSCPDLGGDLPTHWRSGNRLTGARVERGWRGDGWSLLRVLHPDLTRPGWSRGDSNPGPPPCKGGALPAKLRPRYATAPAQHPRFPPSARRDRRDGWARLDSNQGPRPYQGRALTA